MRSVLVGLYPRAFRDRWGQELVDEAERTGGWQLVRDVAGMWLHPAIWPADSVLERRRRVAALAVVVTAAGWLTAHAVLELTGAVPRALSHSWVLTGCDLITFVGFALAVPLPRRSAVVDLAGVIVRRLAVPGVVGAGAVVAANRGVLPAVLVVVAWWLALSFAALQAVRTVADVELSAVLVPSGRRLGVGLWLAAIGLTATAVTMLLPAVAGRGDRIAGLVGGGTLLVLAAAVNGTVRDLADVRTV